MYSAGNARIITPIGDRVFLVDAGGQIHRLNETRTGFDAVFDPVDDIDFIYATGLRQHLALVEHDGAGNTRLYYMYPNNPQLLQHIAYLHTAGSFTTPAQTYDQSCLFMVHNDELYFSSFDYPTPALQVVDLYKFNGSQVQHVAHHENTTASHYSTMAGLLTWHGEIILYELSTGSSQTQTFKILTGENFTTLTTISADAAGITPLAFSQGANLILVADPAGNEGVYYASRARLANGNVVTAWFDAGRPALPKRLERVTVSLDSAASDFKVVIKYRVDDETSWTTETTQNNTRRAAVTDLGVSFYRLQLRIELDDDTSGGNQDIRITSVSALYAISE
jgi:hypothetical protein